MLCKKGYASHAAGGELLYEHVSGNTYKFIFKFYRDCSGSNAPNSVRLCYMNTCNVTSPNSRTLQQVSGPVLVGGDCPDIVSNCTTPNGLPSYEEYIYERNVTLSETCNSWRFYVNIATRNPMNFLISNNNVNLYVETSFNNTISNQDDSPIFNRLPVPYCCINTPFNYDNGATDADGDSLVYESIMPREHASTFFCSSAPPILCTYPVLVPPLNFTTNPIPCNNTFSVNPATGLLSMIPSQLGKGAIAIKVSQYRNGQLLGYIVRDIQTIVLTCNISSPLVTVDTNSLINSSAQNDTVTACAGSSFSFCFTTQTNDTTSVLSLQSNVSNFSSPVSLVHTNLYSDSVTSCFNWTSNVTDTGWHFLNVLIIDSICRPIGVLSTDSLTKTFAIYVAPIDTTTIANTICEPAAFLGYSQSGIYVDTFVNQYGCDSIRILNLIVHPIVFSVENKTICAPGNYMGYSATGTYIDTLVNQNGCDSIRTLNLIVNPSATTTLNQTICEPASYLGYNQSGTYTDTLLMSTGCDSFRVLNLVVNPIKRDTINQSICAPSSYLGYSITGTYIDTFVSSAGCDSFRVLNLNVFQSTSQTIAQTICAPGNYLGYTATGTYIDTLVNANGCDSLRTLNLTVNPTYVNTLNQTICEPATFLGYSQSGTYTDTFILSTGCDSIRILNLVVHPIKRDTINQSICAPSSYLGYSMTGTYIDTFVSSAGCDSFRVLNLSVFQNTSQTILQSICAPGSYLGYSTTGIYIDTLVNSNGCDSVRTLNLTVSPVVTQTIAQTICAFDSYQGYNQSGTYIDTFISFQGCDSIRTLNLTVLALPHDTVVQVLCEPLMYQGYSVSGTYIDTFTAVTGCDSVRTLNLTIHPKSFQTINQAICQFDSFQGYSATGTYIDTFLNINGCDSVRTLNLIVNPHTDTTITLTICQPANYVGYTSTGTYIDTLVNASGCDSIRTLNLTVNPITFSTINQTICQPASFLGYSTTGIYIDTLVNSNGCDSIRTLNLLVNPITFSTINQSICQFDSYLGYTASGTYIDTLVNANGCDSVRTLNLIVNVHTFSLYDSTICFPSTVFGYGASGTYIDTLVNANGCDSTRTLILQVNQPSDTTISAVICADTSFLGYNQTGVFIDTFVNAVNCDSIRTLNLTVHPTYYIDTTIYRCLGDSIFAGGNWQAVGGVYWDSVTSINGCDSITKTTFVPQQIIFPYLGPDQEICNGERITLTPGGFNSYLWNDGDTNELKVISVAGQYIVRVANFDGCFGYDTLNLSIIDPPLLNILYTDSAICIGDRIVLKGTGASNYEWKLPDGNGFYFSNDSIVTFQFKNKNEAIQLAGWDLASCKDTTYTNLFSTNCCGGVLMPNAFSPNNDGRNDYFGLVGKDKFFEDFSFQIFNRWGLKVFNASDASVRWDGTFKGQYLDIGTYYYVIRLKCYGDNESQIIKGDVTIIR